MDACAARLQPLVDQNKPKQHQTFAIEKFRELIVTIQSCPGDEKISFKKKVPGNLQKIFVNNETFQKPIT